MSIRLPKVLFAAGFAGALLLNATLVQGPAAAADLTPEQKATFETVIKDYILEHPEVIEDALALLDKRRADQAALQQKNAISQNASLIFNSPRQVVLGNPQGDVTIVEFFDYNCGYCKQAMNDMLGIINEDKNVRFVLKEFPVLSAGSEEAARVGVAVNRLAPDKYFEFHKRLLGGRGQANKARALDVAVEVGLDRARVEAEATNASEVTASLKETHTIAEGLGLNGTPSYIVGRTVIPGAVGADRLKERIADARAQCAAGASKPC